MTPLALDREQAWSHAWLVWALGELGTKESNGTEDNPRIVFYHSHTNGGPAPDSMPWCSSFINAAMAHAKITGTRSKAAASWTHWGVETPLRLGAVLLWGKADPDAKGTGHVALCAGWDDRHVLAIGGNQGNQVSAVLKPRQGLITQRWPAHMP
jgi:uncharacterized protein (TIGR02594 family)